MGKNIQTKDTIEEYKERLREITQIQFGVLSDDAILRFLAERTRLSSSVLEYEKIQREEADRLEQERMELALKAAEKKKGIILKKIEELNKAISPDKKDDDLLVLISERKKLEKELETINREFPSEEKTVLSDVALEDVEKPSETTTAVEPKEEIVEMKASTIVPEVISSEVILPKEEFGNEKIQDDGIEENSEFSRYFDQLKNNVGSLGEFLQQMPSAAKKNKAFMLKVATIDPAYAMHYADKDTLKRDEDFNMRIASFHNSRNSGNALSEMLPEARTSKVLLVAVKQDYRNVKFIQPAMVDYDEIINSAKKGALEKVKNLKEAADATLLVPRLLQQDKQFMLQIKEITDVKKEE